MESKIFLCSACFLDEGIKLNAYKIGIINNDKCPHCGKKDGKKLTAETLIVLSQQYFVRGSLYKTEYGAAPVIQFNIDQKTNIHVSADLQADIVLLEQAIGVGFFYYGPRMWMVGEIEPLISLQNELEFNSIVERIIKEYPVRNLLPIDQFYRLRKQPSSPESDSQYDPPPSIGKGRFDDVDFPVLYGSQDFEVCIHECRVTVEDELFIATIESVQELKLLDLTFLLKEEGSEFESLDLAILMLFYAPSHSYPICRKLAKAIKEKGFDGIIYPSYFSTVRTGVMPFETVYGVSLRKLPLFNDYSNSQVIPNIVLFGRPIAEGKVKVKCINRLVLNQVAYDIQFGPLIMQPKINIEEIGEKLQKMKEDLLDEGEI